MLLHTGAPAKTAPTAEARSEGGDHAHVGTIVLGLLEARASHVDFLDTVAGEELSRLYRLRKAHRRDARPTSGDVGTR